VFACVDVFSSIDLHVLMFVFLEFCSEAVLGDSDKNKPTETLNGRVEGED